MGEANIDYIAWWGAGLSTLLALVKFWEIWQDRFRIDIGYDFTSDPEIGNKIHIRNLAGKPIMIVYWELFYRSHWWPLRKDAHINSPELDTGDVRIAGHSSKTINFREWDHFNTGGKAMQGRHIYIRLHIAGRRKIVKKVYSG